MSTVQLLSTAVVAAGAPTTLNVNLVTFQAVATAASGTVTGTILIQVSNDGANWITMGTITLNATTPAFDGFASAAMWEYVRANLTAVSAATTVVVTMNI
jgi:hypothetical protein